MNKWLFSVGLSVVLLAGCVSSGPKTQYFSLFSMVPDKAPSQAPTSPLISLGVGPVSLPEFMENPAVVSTTASQQVRVSGYYAWAGELKSSIARVVAANLSTVLQTDNVWQFPWDARARPSYQLRVAFNQFNGERGGDVKLVANWLLIDTRENTSVLVRSSRFSTISADDSIDAYVAALNTLLNQFSQTLAEEVSVFMAGVEDAALPSVEGEALRSVTEPGTSPFVM